MVFMHAMQSCVHRMLVLWRKELITSKEEAKKFKEKNRNVRANVFVIEINDNCKIKIIIINKYLYTQTQFLALALTFKGSIIYILLFYAVG